MGWAQAAKASSYPNTEGLCPRLLECGSRPCSPFEEQDPEGLTWPFPWLTQTLIISSPQPFGPVSRAPFLRFNHTWP